MAGDIVKAKKTAETASFEPFVSPETYGVWVKMLKTLVPHGRTHRLAVVVAGMIQHTANMVYERDPELYEQLFDFTDYDHYDVGSRQLIPYVEKLFKDAKVKSRRTNSRGETYSIVESALMEHERWDYMPWE